ncbi:hypothetical protein IP957_00140 [Leptospira borgpetersenii serovar Ballum]|uniref:hypothetical protein n=1 Tax=Leptospira borgpetersenii TaxID=174 RepID=UPI001881E1DE|nr:hypothetical protein [Leptospira borgpetersenii]MBE8310324.1 hypothetical protein [Leptospira borgpetersenii serovar Ballum]
MSVPVAPSAKIQRNSKSTNEQLCVGSRSVPVAPSAKIQRNSKSTNEQLCVGSSRPIRYILT